MTLMQAVVGLGCAVGLLTVIYGPWQWICADYARQILFEKRDAIFDLARAGKLSFDSREYQTIRSSLQSSIRFAHTLTWPRFVVLAISARNTLRQPSAMSMAIKQISDFETRNEVQRLVTESSRALLIMMVLKSPLLVVLSLFGGVAYVAVASQTKRAAEWAEETIQVEAENAPERDDWGVRTLAA